MDFRLNKFSKRQIDRMSEYLSNLSLVFIASLIASIFTGGKINYALTLSAVMLSAGSLVISLLII